MDDKMKRELSAAVDRGADDPSTQKLIARDAQARAYFDGLLAVDRALRAWPAPEAAPSERDSDAFVDAVLARLDQPMSDDFDPFAVPFADEREAQKTPRKHSEQHAMSQSNDQDNEDDLEGLAALMRPSRTGSSASVPPPPVSVRPGPALTDDAMDESSGIVDIKHLAAIAKRASVPPATADEAAAKSDEKKADEKKADEKKADEKKADSKKGDDKPAAKADAKKSDDKSASKADASAEKKSEKKLQAVPAATAVSEPVAEKKGTSPVVWIAGIGIAAGIAFVAGRQGNNPTATVNAEAPQSAAAPAQSPVLTAGTGGAERAQQAPTPAAQPAVPPAAQPAAPSGAQAAVTDQAAAPSAEGAAPSIGGAAAAGAPSPTPAPTTVAAAAPGNSPAESESAPRRAIAEPAAAARTATRETATTGAASEPSRPSTATSTGSSRTSAPAASDTAAAPSGSSGSSARGGSGAAAAPATNTATPAAANTQGARPRSVEELMAAATGRTATPTAAPTATTASTVPPQLTRSMVQSTMSPFNSAVRACAQGQTGTATAILTVNGDGSVANAAVSSPWGSGPNDCITNRLRTARFPAVQRPSSRVVYPFAVLAPQPGG